MPERLYSRWEARKDSSELPPPWKRAEEYAIEEFQLEEDHASWHDARDGDGDPVEIKSCVIKYADGGLGKYKIWSSQLVELLRKGQVALILYAHDNRHTVVASHLVDPLDLKWAGSASLVDHPTMGRRLLRRIPWTEVIPLEELEVGARHHFADEYPEDEAEDVFFLCETDKLIRLY